MGAQKNKGAKAVGKKPISRKTRRWIRDGLNIFGGLVVGALVCFVVQEYRQHRQTLHASEKYLEAVRASVPLMKPFAERYLALDEGRVTVLQSLEAVDVSAPVYPMDRFVGIKEESRHLSADTLPLLWDFYLDLHDAELMRKLIREQQESPAKMFEVLCRGFLRGVYEGSQLVPKLTYELGQSAAKGTKETKSAGDVKGTKAGKVAQDAQGTTEAQGAKGGEDATGRQDTPDAQGAKK